MADAITLGILQAVMWLGIGACAVSGSIWVIGRLIEAIIHRGDPYVTDCDGVRHYESEQYF